MREGCISVGAVLMWGCISEGRAVLWSGGQY